MRRWRSSRLLAILLPGFGVPFAACAQRPAAPPQHESALLNSIAREHRCRPALPVETLGDSIPNACALAAATFDAVAHGRARKLGVAPADTSRIIRAVVASMTFRDPKTGLVADSYWSVVLVIENRDFGLGARIDRATGALTLGRTEVPATPRPHRPSP